LALGASSASRFAHGLERLRRLAVAELREGHERGGDQRGLLDRRLEIFFDVAQSSQRAATR
jgi:hypothetical protein